MTPVFAGHVREGASDVLLRGRGASEVNRFQDRSNSLSSNGRERKIAAIVMSSSCSCIPFEKMLAVSLEAAPLHLGTSRQIWPSLYVFTPPQCPASASMRQAAGLTEGE